MQRLRARRIGTIGHSVALLASVLVLAWLSLHWIVRPTDAEVSATPQPRLAAVWQPTILPTDTPQPSATPRPISSSAENGTPDHIAHARTMVATGYSCGGLKTAAERALNCPHGITASGTTPTPGRTMACPGAWLGRRFKVEGFGVLTCEDTGGAITSGRLDIYFGHVDEALTFGRRVVKVEEML